jgi:hypothetical protein
MAPFSDVINLTTKIDYYKIYPSIFWVGLQPGLPNHLLNMPLHTAQDPTNPEDLKGVSEEYLLFFSSVVDGKMWCPVRDVR